MSGGDRSERRSALLAVLSVGFILAVWAALAIGYLAGFSAQEHETYPRYKQAADNRAGTEAPPGLNVHPPEYRQPCRDPQGHDESDLCAQYRAASAAGSAAFWAYWQFWLSIFGVAGLIGTILLTIRATNAAVESNRIAMDTAKRQLRAYLATGEFRLARLKVDQAPILTFRVKNVGQTPASELRCYAEAFVRTADITDPDPVKFTRTRRHSNHQGAVLGAGERVTYRIRFDSPYTAAHVAGIRDGRHTIYVAGVLSFRDTFGRRRLLTFYLHLNPNNLKQSGRGRLGYCPRGNKAN